MLLDPPKYAHKTQAPHWHDDRKRRAYTQTSGRALAQSSFVVGWRALGCPHTLSFRPCVHAHVRHRGGWLMDAAVMEDECCAWAVATVAPHLLGLVVQVPRGRVREPAPPPPRGA